MTFSLLATCLATVQARASDIAVVLPNSYIEQLGWPTTYSVANTTPNFSYNATWSKRENDAYCVSPWVNFNQGELVNFGIPGGFDIQCVILYQGNSTGATPPGPETLLRHVTIPYPVVSATVGLGDTAAYCDPNNPPTGNVGPNGQPGTWIYFEVTSGGQPFGPELDEIGAQESITNMYAPGTVNGTSGGWVPTQTGNQLFLFGTEPDGTRAICDFKFVAQPPTGIYPTGQFITYTQEIRLVWRAWDGSSIRYGLGTKKYSESGSTNPNVWQTNIVP